MVSSDANKTQARFCHGEVHLWKNSLFHGTYEAGNPCKQEMSKKGQSICELYEKVWY
jgi:hypothetical protein